MITSRIQMSTFERTVTFQYPECPSPDTSIFPYQEEGNDMSDLITSRIQMSTFERTVTFQYPECPSPDTSIFPYQEKENGVFRFTT
ncbi:hypothetical protein AVEN_126332-1 [Araneus ventricosus]|uniref:Uncharacterized protein n=1 Tax=Araneus ventricosus TaxID=182803 RepID=A0A4Y2T8E7_ARAVE|nr:hypothetical protein AVEN_126332-1 [Araneus ventricosus]